VNAGPESEQPHLADPLLDAVAVAARELRDVEEQHRASANRLADALLSAHRGGFTWSEVASAADLGSAETARVRAYRAQDADVPPSLRWRRERGSAPRPSSSESAEGLSVSEAAKRLKVSRKTVYARIRAGKLKASKDDAGRTRVLLDQE